MSEELDIGLGVLDHQLLDSEGRRCGNVDDLAIEGEPGGEAEVVAILSGPGVWPQRAGALGRLAAWIGGGGRIRVPWGEVVEVESHVRLRKKATDYGLGRGDDRVRPWIEWIPGSDR
jgi:sporulation protein YlmC with PRC-barrel domain